MRHHIIAETSRQPLNIHCGRKRNKRPWFCGTTNGYINGRVLSGGDLWPADSDVKIVDLTLIAEKLNTRGVGMLRRNNENSNQGMCKLWQKPMPAQNLPILRE